MSFWHEPYVTRKEFEEREKRIYERISQAIAAFDEAMDFLAEEHGWCLQQHYTGYHNLETVSPRRFEQVYHPPVPPQVKRCPKKEKSGA